MHCALTAKIKFCCNICGYFETANVNMSLMARLKKRQKNKGGAFGNIAASAMGNKSKVKSTKVVPVKKKDNNRKPSKARPPPPPPKKKA